MVVGRQHPEHDRDAVPETWLDDPTRRRYRIAPKRWSTSSRRENCETICVEVKGCPFRPAPYIFTDADEPRVKALDRVRREMDGFVERWTRSIGLLGASRTRLEPFRV